jgi:fructose-bisphosphate aldolase class 1
MSIEQLAETAQAMVAAGKGIIAIDESTHTIASVSRAWASRTAKKTVAPTARCC